MNAMIERKRGHSPQNDLNLEIDSCSVQIPDTLCYLVYKDQPAHTHIFARHKLSISIFTFRATVKAIM